MSLSNLGSQLAALNNSTATSRKNEDAVGRGVNYSSKRGHSFLSGPASRNRKASILYTEKQASEISFTKLRENAYDSLQQLSVISQDEGLVHEAYLEQLFGLKTIHQERGLMTSSQNQSIDTHIVALLKAISILLYADKDDSSTQVLVLHVIEYLVARYDIHARDKTAHFLLMVTLPFHSSPFFLKIIKLIDLASICNQQWVFLRPYAGKNVEGTVPRTEFAKQIGKSTSRIGEKFIEDLCLLAQDAARLATSMPKAQKAISYRITFVAAILHEAINMQQLQHGNLPESTVRCLLPFILSSCKGNKIKYFSPDDSSKQEKDGPPYYCLEWRNFGYLMATLIARKTTLSFDTKEVLANAIVDGIISSSRYHKDVLGEVLTTTKEIEATCDSLVTLMVILQSGVGKVTKEFKAQQRLQVKKEVAKLDCHDILYSDKFKLMAEYGIPLPRTTFSLLLNIPKSTLLPVSLAHLQKSRNIEVSFFLGTLLSQAITNLAIVSSDGSDKVDSSPELQLIKYLAKQKELKNTWSFESKNKISSLASSAVIYVYTTGKFNDSKDAEAAKDSKDNLILQQFQAALSSIQIADPVGCNSGIAKVVKEIFKGSTKTKKGMKEMADEDRDKILTKKKERLSQILNLSQSTSDKASNDDDMDVDGDDDEDVDREESSPKKERKKKEKSYILEMSNLLPSSIAIEHPNKDVRLSAIRRIQEEALSPETKLNDKRQSITMLLRRIYSDDEAKVAIAAHQAVQKVASEGTGKIDLNSSEYQPTAEQALKAIQKWSSLDLLMNDVEQKKDAKKKSKSKKAQSKSKTNLASISLSFCGNAAKTLISRSTKNKSLLQELNSDLPLINKLLQSIISHLQIMDDDDSDDSYHKEVQDSAAIALLQSFSISPVSKDESAVLLQAKTVLVQNTDLIDLFCQNLKSLLDEDENKRNLFVGKKHLQNKTVCGYILVTFKEFVQYIQKTKKAIPGESNVLNLISIGISCLDLFPEKQNHHAKDDFADCLLQVLLDFMSGCVSILSSDGGVTSSSSKSLLSVMTDLASIHSKTTYDFVCTPTIQKIVEHIKVSQYSHVSNKDATVMGLLMETLLRLDLSSSAPARLLEFITNMYSNKENVDDPGAVIESLEKGMISCLYLLASASASLRKASLKYLNIYSRLVQDSPTKDISSSAQALAKLCAMASEKNATWSLYSDLIMDGESSFPSLLNRSIGAGQSSENPTELKKAILDLCVKTVTEQFGYKTGTCRAVAYILRVISTKLNDDVFSLVEQWNFAGKAILQSYLNYEQQNREGGGFEDSTPLQELLDCIVNMLKGVIVKESESGAVDSVIVSNPGRRQRSYSISTTQGTAFVHPYPEDMINTLKDVLSKVDPSSYLYNQIIQVIFKSASWGDGVFSKFASQTKRKIALMLLKSQVNGNQSAKDVLYTLPLDIADYLFLWKSMLVGKKGIVGAPDERLITVNILADYIRVKSNETTVCKSSVANELTTLVFDELVSLSTIKKGNESTTTDYIDDIGSDYVSFSLLKTCISLVEFLDKVDSSPAKKGRHSNATTTKHAEKAIFLVALVGPQGVEQILPNDDNDNDSIVIPLVSNEARSTALKLLALLCSKSPKNVATSLIPAMIHIITASSKLARDEGEEETADLSLVPKDNTIEFESQLDSVSEVLKVIVPTFCEYGETAGLSIIDLLTAFIVATKHFTFDQNIALYKCMGNALISLGQENKNGGIGSLICSFIASEAFYRCKNSNSNSNEGENDKNYNSFAINMLRGTSPSIHMATFVQLIQYVGSMVTTLLPENKDEMDLDNRNEQNEKEMDIVYRISHSDLISLALNGPESEEKKSMNDDDDDKQDNLRMSTSTYPSDSQRAIMWLSTIILSVVRSGISRPVIRRAARKSHGDDINVSLLLWQQLMHIQSQALYGQRSFLNNNESTSRSKQEEDVAHDSKRFWDAIHFGSQESLESLQNILPVPQFLACTTALIKDDNLGQNFRKRALVLLSDRASEVSDTSETMLFLETIPDLLEIISTTTTTEIDEENESQQQQNAVTQQTALWAIEQLAGSLVRSRNPLLTKVQKMKSIFEPALRKIVELVIVKAPNKLFVSTSSGMDDDESEQMFDAVQGQLLGSAALCIATIISIIKQHSIPFLKKLLNSILSSLSLVNEYQVKLEDDSKSSSTVLGEEENQHDQLATQKLLQKSLLRSLLIITESLSTFLGPYLKRMFSPSCLPSVSLTKNDDLTDTTSSSSSLKQLSEELNKTIAAKVPIRLLAPVLGQHLSAYSGNNKNNFEEKKKNWREAGSILFVLSQSIQNSSRSELSSLVGVIVNALMSMYSWDIGTNKEDYSNWLQSLNQCFMSLIMKLSEAQLRPIYAQFREWRGEIESAPSSTTTAVDRDAVIKRHAFWSLSTVLSKNLKGIFLPCFSTVVLDVVKELELAVFYLVDFSSKKGSKRRKINKETFQENDNDDDGLVSMIRPFQSVLSCLEAALKADALLGGDWVRAEDGQRYSLIQSPLSKLLQAKIPSSLMIEVEDNDEEYNKVSAFQKIVQGVGTSDTGNVTSTLTSLAAAAGNEQLWKPLNHAIIDACGNEERSEVRKGGVNCLLSLLKLLGEEYMVLLPECLPILSELLESGDEEIAYLAKECITLGEELLGESLEDSLR